MNIMITDETAFKSRSPKSGIVYPMNSNNPDIGYGLELKPKAQEKIKRTETDHFIGGLYTDIINEMKLEEYNAEPVNVSSQIPLVIKENILYPQTKKPKYESRLSLDANDKNVIE